jgi:hypothetical protein
MPVPWNRNDDDVCLGSCIGVARTTRPVANDFGDRGCSFGVTRPDDNVKSGSRETSRKTATLFASTTENGDNTSKWIEIARIAGRSSRGISHVVIVAVVVNLRTLWSRMSPHNLLQCSLQANCDALVLM